ncbi:ABC transporter permease [Corynebacterium felinum]|uniref:Peptide/nickel transport system permease protein n=1 Tax=Corynebacterium felinum TaxID=131318 RepID=A0ABU2B6W7_9CORY|nr:ABC transporter permease [Corynebacterium felinum]MDF5821407.1 ABC transporter permease [Corynebacterium felinum]MDR7353503.1 peptide/nickel transport system permease protein [Corynebacterium felinum]WJY95682.1 Glutathione transport system permease protein GsiC [Corynebacterium felinum]
MPTNPQHPTPPTLAEHSHPPANPTVTGNGLAPAYRTWRAGSPQSGHTRTVLFLGAALLRYLLTLLVASVVIFIALRIIPGNPAEVVLGVTATKESVAELSASMGLDQPLWSQYFSWITSLATGDFGHSLISGTDISPLVFDRLLVSLLLVAAGMTVALGIALPFGVWAAARAKYLDGLAITALSQMGIAVPSFVAALILVASFSVHLGWFPANGWSVPNQDFPGFLSRLVLPAVSLGLVQAAIMTRYVRGAVLDIMTEEFMRTARAKGLSPRQALFRHGIRNAALPVVTVTGVQLTSLLIGAVVIEKVFVIPGLGSLLLTAVTTRDLPTVQTIVMLLVVCAVIINALVDLTYIIVDPRTRRRK